MKICARVASQNCEIGTRSIRSDSEEHLSNGANSAFLLLG